MAEEAPVEEAQQTVPAKRGKKILIIIVAVVVIAVGGAIGVTVALTGGGADAEVAEGEGGVSAEEPAGDAIYVTLEPAFVVNFQDRNAHTKFLKAEIDVVTFDEDMAEAIAKHMPAIRNNLVLLLSRQIYDDLVPHEGKEQLRAAALAEVQSVLEKRAGGPGVEELYFTSFVMQ